MKVAAVLRGHDSARSDGRVLRVAAQLGEVTALAVGPDDASSALGRARAVGAERLVRIWDAALASALESASGSSSDGGRAPDEPILATVLAAAARFIDAQIFVIGETSTGLVGPALAEQLNLPHVSSVIDATRDESDPAPDTAPTVIVRRLCLRGVQRLRGPACGVLCTLPDPLTSKAGPVAPIGDVEVWDLEHIGLGGTDLPRPLLRPVTPERTSRFVPRSYASVELLLERLRQDGLGQG